MLLPVKVGKGEVRKFLSRVQLEPFVLLRFMLPQHDLILVDVRFRVTPLSDQDAREMVREIRGYRLLQGYRGHPPADIEAIEEVLLRVSRLVEDIPRLNSFTATKSFLLAIVGTFLTCHN